MTGAGSRTGSRRGLWALRTVAAVVLAVHGLIQLMGVALLWRWGQPGELRYDDVSPEADSTPGIMVGAVWLVA